MAKVAKVKSEKVQMMKIEQAGVMLDELLELRVLAKEKEATLKAFMADNDQLFEGKNSIKIAGVGFIEKKQTEDLKCEYGVPIQDIQSLIEEECLLTPYLKKEISASYFPKLFKESELIRDMTESKKLEKHAKNYGLFIKSNGVVYSFK